jgi:hypothetical protein
LDVLVSCSAAQISKSFFFYSYVIYQFCFNINIFEQNYTHLLPCVGFAGRNLTLLYNWAMWGVAEPFISCDAY